MPSRLDNRDAPESVAHPQVTVAIACYNADRTIRSAIDSLLGQTQPAFEIVVVDDASTDRSLEILRGIEDPRLKVIANPSNEGPGTARDRAIASGSAPWIALMDADDQWHPDRLRAMLQVADSHGACMVFDNLMMCHDTPSGQIDWRPLRRAGAFGARGESPVRVPARDYILSDRLLIKPIFPRKVVESNFIHHSSRRFAEDAEYFIRVLATGLPMYYLPRPLYRYRITPGSLTAASERHSEMRECLEELYDQPGLSADIRDALTAKFQSLRKKEAQYALLAALRRGDASEAAALVLHDPSLLVSAIRRGSDRIRYEWHRIRHRGTPRS